MSAHLSNIRPWHAHLQPHRPSAYTVVHMCQMHSTNLQPHQLTCPSPWCLHVHISQTQLVAVYYFLQTAGMHVRTLHSMQTSPDQLMDVRFSIHKPFHVASTVVRAPAAAGNMLLRPESNGCCKLRCNHTRVIPSHITPNCTVSMHTVQAPPLSRAALRPRRPAS